MKYISLLIIAISVSGCAGLTGYSHEYPPNWAAYDNKAEECHNISGKYINIGDEKYDLGEYEQVRKSLGYRLLGFHAFQTEMNVNNYYIAESIYNSKVANILQTKQTLEVNLIADDGTHYSKIWNINESEVTCSSGWLWVPQGSIKAGDGTGGHYNTFKIGIRKAIDGTLVAQEHNTMVGALLWVLPVAGNQIMWYRWSLDGESK